MSDDNGMSEDDNEAADSTASSPRLPVDTVLEVRITLELDDEDEDEDMEESVGESFEYTANSLLRHGDRYELLSFIAGTGPSGPNRVYFMDSEPQREEEYIPLLHRNEDDYTSRYNELLRSSVLPGAVPSNLTGSPIIAPRIPLPDSYASIVETPVYNGLYSAMASPGGIMGRLLSVASNLEDRIVARLAHETLESFSAFERSERTEPQLLIEDFSEEQDKDEKCTICLELYKPDDQLTYPDCGHRFHYDCLHTWAKYKTECPLCRCEIPVRYIQESEDEIDVSDSPTGANVE